MPTSPTLVRRSAAAFALALTFLPTAAQAGWLQDYSVRFYGQNFYDHRHKPYRNADGRIRQQNVPPYGPVMIYTRDYGDAYPDQTVRDQPFTPDHRRINANAAAGYGGSGGYGSYSAGY